MISWAKNRLYELLRWSERYTKTDMVYFASGNFWLIFGRAIGIGSGLLLTVAFANWLSPETFGTYKYILAAAGFIGAFTLNGLGAAVMRIIAQGQKNAFPGIVRAAVLWSLPASLVALAIAGYYFFNDNQILGWSFTFIALSNAIANGVGLAKAALVGAGDFKATTLASIPRTLFPIVAILGTVYFTENIIFIVFAYFASNAFASWVLYRWTLRHLSISASPAGVSEAVKFGAHMSVLGFFFLISGKIDQLLLWHFASPTDLAIYALALVPVQETKNLLDNFLSIAFPKLAAKDESDARRTLPFRMKQMLAVSVFVAVIFIITVPFLFKYLFPKYLAAVLVAQVLAVIIILQPKGFIDLLFTAHGLVGKRYAAILTSQAVELVLFLALIPLYGLWGAVAATVLSEIVSGIALMVMFRRS